MTGLGSFPLPPRPLRATSIARKCAKFSVLPNCVEVCKLNLRRLIHALQPNRAELRILVGPKPNSTLQSWGGMASTPLFDHLGSLWHWPDNPLLDLLRRCIRWSFSVLTVGVILLATHRIYATFSRGRGVGKSDGVNSKSSA